MSAPELTPHQLQKLFDRRRAGLLPEDLDADKAFLAQLVLLRGKNISPLTAEQRHDYTLGHVPAEGRVLTRDAADQQLAALNARSRAIDERRAANSRREADRLTAAAVRWQTP